MRRQLKNTVLCRPRFVSGFFASMNNKPVGTTVEDIYPSRWLRPEHLGEKTHVVTIAHVEPEEMQQRDGSKELKLVLTFAGAQKQLACNVTQARRMAELAGTQVFKEWIGKRVTLFPAVATNNKATIGIGPAPDVPAKTTETTT